METTFRVAEPADAETLLALMRGLYEHDNIAFDASVARAALSQLLADDTCGLASLILMDGEVAGYVVITFGFSLEFRGRDAFVDELFVKEESRGRGAGMAALRFAEEVCHARGVRALHLEVERSNIGAQAIYRRAGFLDHDRYLLTKWLD